MTEISIVIRNISRYLKNWLMLESECIYHVENPVIDHVTKSATDIHITEI